jgi:hypothetical protein
MFHCAIVLEAYFGISAYAKQNLPLTHRCRCECESGFSQMTDNELLLVDRLERTVRGPGMGVLRSSLAS